MKKKGLVLGFATILLLNAIVYATGEHYLYLIPLVVSIPIGIIASNYDTKREEEEDND